MGPNRCPSIAIFIAKPHRAPPHNEQFALHG